MTETRPLLRLILRLDGYAITATIDHELVEICLVAGLGPVPDRLVNVPVGEVAK